MMYLVCSNGEKLLKTKKITSRPFCELFVFYIKLENFSFETKNSFLILTDEDACVRLIWSDKSL